MKDPGCIDADRIHELVALPDDAAERSHARSCPRCRALLEAYQLFLAPSSSAPDPETDAADARLTRFRREMLAIPRTPSSIAREPWWRAAFAPRLRPAWAALVLVVVSGTWLGVVQWTRGPEPPPRYRGEALSGMRLAAPRWNADGSAELEWAAYPGAERYEVRFYDTSMRELGRIDAGSHRGVRVARERLPGALAAGEPVLFRVRALRGPDELARSAVGTLVSH